MEHKETHKVTKHNGSRPAGKPGVCFYCGQPVGSDHKPDCVLRGRTVTLELRLEVTVGVPDFWTEHDIEFHYNDSSYCLSNILDDLRRPDCLCDLGKVKFLREATEQDDKNYRLEKL